MRPCHTRRMRHRRRIVSIDMQHSRSPNLLIRNILRPQRQTLRPLPKHRPLARRLIDHNIRRLVRAIRPHLHMLQVHARPAQALHLHTPALIVPQRANIFRPQPQLRARHHRARHLPPRTQYLFMKRNLAPISRKMRNNQQRIGRIQPNAEHIVFSRQDPVFHNPPLLL